jgi:hypothetical protein
MLPLRVTPDLLLVFQRLRGLLRETMIGIERQ